MPPGKNDVGAGRRLLAYLLIAVLMVLGAVAVVIGPLRSRAVGPADAAPSAPPPVTAATVSASPQVTEVFPVAAPAPKGLPVLGYFTAPKGFPPDADPESTAAVPTGLRPRTTLAVYDAPGGRPRAMLPRAMSGLPVTVPIVERRSGWVAVLLPTVNRTVGWLPAKGWTAHELPNQLVLHLKTRELTWLRDGARKVVWTIAVGTPATPTPPGRTYVMGRTGTSGKVYAGLDALALGSVPEDPKAVSPGLRSAHTGIHAWYRDDAFGRNVSNGCLRMPPAAQRILLAEIPPGTVVSVVD